MSDCCQPYVDALKSAVNKETAQKDLDTCRLIQTQNPDELYTTLNSTDPSMYHMFTKCIQTRIIDADKPLLGLINDYAGKKEDAITASELNRNTMTLYQVDLNYTIGKVFMFIILFLAYFFFLNGVSVIEPIKTGVQQMGEKISNFTVAPIK
jgi:hypothetical protein